jgi:hemoglobin
VLTDIADKLDIERVVREQYRKLLADEFTAPVFAHLNLEAHLPKIFTFWSFVLDIDAGNNPYRGNAFEPHTKLGLTAEHFRRWLNYLHQTIFENFKGPNAEKWVAKSNELGLMFEYKMGLINDGDFIKVKNRK